MYMSISPKYKLCNNQIEKKLLRNTFKNILPISIYNRKKEAFSDSVSTNSNNIINEIKKYTATIISDEVFERRQYMYINNIPLTKESFYYR